MKSKGWHSKAQFGFFKAPGGWCAAVWTTKGLSALILPQETKTAALRKLHEYLPPMPGDFWNRPPQPVPEHFRTQILNALQGKLFRSIPIDISFLTPFQQRILRATCLIPWGEVRNYGWVARKAGSPRGFRAAGQALNRNTVPLFIPCHRVIGSGNRLGGYGGGIDWKIRLLRNEGLWVKAGPENDYRVGKL